MHYRDVRHPEQYALALVLAGGNGTRLGALTRWHAKPALPFGGQYRNVDFPLSNCVNSGIRRIALLTQYKSHSLIQHVQQGWNFLRPEIGEFIELWPAQQRRGEGWYAGTADAVFQNVDLIESHGASHVLILAGDHVYKMDYRAMLDTHVESGAEVTVGCVEVPLAEASDFGVMAVDQAGWIRRFDEKPRDPEPLPQNPARALASMGIYVFDRDVLLARLLADARDSASTHDFGRDLLPAMIGSQKLRAHAFRDAVTGGKGYWRDVGTVDSYWQANMELLADAPELDLHDSQWPIRTHQPQSAPPRFVGEGYARRSIVANGCGVAGAVEHSVLSTGARVEGGAVVAGSIVLPHARIGRNCRIQRAIIDSGCVIPEGTVIDGRDGSTAGPFHLSPKRVTLVTTAMLDRLGEPARQRHVA
jgi:glucose-1-phosphate adenylyltransferase